MRERERQKKQEKYETNLINIRRANNESRTYQSVPVPTTKTTIPDDADNKTRRTARRYDGNLTTWRLHYILLSFSSSLSLSLSIMLTQHADPWTAAALLSHLSRRMRGIERVPSRSDIVRCYWRLMNFTHSKKYNLILSDILLYIISRFS